MGHSLPTLVENIVYLHDPDNFFSITPIQDISPKLFCKTKVHLTHLCLTLEDMI